MLQTDRRTEPVRRATFDRPNNLRALLLNRTRTTLCTPHRMATHTALQHALESRLRAHPEDLADVVRSLTATYTDVRRARTTDPQAAAARLDALLTKVRCLLQLPADALPVDGTAWRGQRRIVDDCEVKRAALDDGEHDHGVDVGNGRDMVGEAGADQQQPVPPATDNAPTLTRYDHALPDTMLAPWIQDWHDPTLQTTAARRLARHVALPVLYPEHLRRLAARHRAVVGLARRAPPTHAPPRGPRRHGQELRAARGEALPEATPGGRAVGPVDGLRVPDGRRRTARRRPLSSGRTATSTRRR